MLSSASAGFDSMMRGGMFVGLRATIALILLTGCATPRVLFDDFNYSRSQARAARGWIIRSEPGLRGVTGAAWGTESRSLNDDPQRPGNRRLLLPPVTDG